MSATNRGGQREASDYYVTPAWAIDDVLQALSEDAERELGFDFSKPLTILDPCAGGDSRRGMAYPEAIARRMDWHVEKLTTIDIREDSRADIKADYLKISTCGHDIVITNPPFSNALEVIQKALKDVRHNGLVVMLQRVNFFGGQERSTWMKAHLPVLTYAHARRMRFHEKGARSQKTGKLLSGDSIEYAHFVWQRLPIDPATGKFNNYCYPKFSKLRVIS